MRRISTTTTLFLPHLVPEPLDDLALLANDAAHLLKNKRNADVSILILFATKLDFCWVFLQSDDCVEWKT